MSFQEVLNQLLKAIEKKNFKQLEACLPPEGPIAAIMCDGTVLEDVEDYLEFHKEWFEDGEWSITHDIVFTEETTEMSYAVVENEYFDKDDDGSYSMTLLTTCVMRHVEGRWVLTLFQQTEAGVEDS
ncbi:MAG: nuclear transport factor 2 family protein [Pseudobacteriovorax sp.]|nr:nuclear transport factor 2 family protein [Pseudobacteriovorax sp.]